MPAYQPDLTWTFGCCMLLCSLPPFHHPRGTAVSSQAQQDDVRTPRGMAAMRSSDQVPLGMWALLLWLQSGHPCVQQALSTWGTLRICQSAKHRDDVN